MQAQLEYWCTSRTFQCQTNIYTYKRAHILNFMFITQRGSGQALLIYQCVLENNLSPPL